MSDMPAFIPPKTPDPRGRCYICGGNLGVFMWTDEHGTAHTYCVQSERDKWNKSVSGTEVGAGSA